MSSEYIKKATINILSAQSQLETLDSNLEDLRKKIDWSNPWWITVLNHFKVSGEENDRAMAMKIKDELKQFKGPNSIRNR